MVSVLELTGDQQHADNPVSNHLKIYIRPYSHCTVATSRCLHKPIQSSLGSLPINLAIGQLDFGNDLVSDFFFGSIRRFSSSYQAYIGYLDSFTNCAS